MAKLVKKDPSYQLITEIINNLLNERVTQSAKSQRVFDIADLSSISEIPISEMGWSKIANPDDSEVNEIGDSQRKQLEEYLKNIQGEDLKTKIQYINKLYNMSINEIESSSMFGGTQSEKIQSVLSYLVFMKTLTTIITNFNAASAGFVFEAFLGVLLGGVQVPTNSGTIADLRASDGTPISLKLYSDKSVHVGGSYTDLVGDMIKPKTNKDFIQYIVAVKSLQGEKLTLNGSIKVYQFNINLDNIMDVLSLTSKESVGCILLPRRYITSKGKDSVGSVIMNSKELYSFFNEKFEEYKNTVASSSPKVNKMLIKLSQILDEAVNDPEYLFGKSGEKVGFGYSTIKVVDAKQFITSLANENQLNAQEIKSLMPIANGLVGSLKYAVEKRKAIQGEAFENLKQVEWATPQETIRFYNSLSQDDKKKALLNTKGYLQTEQFGMTFPMMLNIIETVPTTEGAEIGTIVIGRAQVIDIIKKMATILGQNIIEISNSLKVLTTSINTYFSSGLTEDSAAEKAKQSAQLISRKTTELRKKQG